MEGFCVDIQRMILEEIATEREPTCFMLILATRLRHLFCVNRTYRRWVTRYVLDTLDRKWFLNRVSQEVAPIPDSWNIIDTLQKQWSKRSPTLFTSFVMYLSSSKDRCKEKAASLLFFTKASILKDLKRRYSQTGIVAVQERQIEREEDFIKRYTERLDTHKEHLEENFKKRDAAENAIQELDKKYKKAKSSLCFIHHRNCCTLLHENILRIDNYNYHHNQIEDPYTNKNCIHNIHLHLLTCSKYLHNDQSLFVTWHSLLLRVVSELLLCFDYLI